MDTLPRARPVEHWAAKYVQAGLRFENGAQGPGAFDCWSFFRLVQREQYGRDVPIVQVEGDLDTEAGRLRWRERVREMFATHPERARWRRVDEPADGDAVLMRSADEPSHIGLWVDVGGAWKHGGGGGVLHLVRKHGVCFHQLTALRLLGWGHIEFWRGA